MHIFRRTRFCILAVGALLAAALVAGCGSSDDKESAATADEAFVRQMVPHHQMAVEMAKMAQGQTQHPELKTLVDNITRTQNAEIAQMTSIAGKLDVKPAAMDSPDMNAMGRDGETLGVPMTKMGMMMDMSTLEGAKPFDRAFIDMMVPHHQGAIRMARGELAKGSDGQSRKLATQIIAAQEKEIGQMNAWRAKWYGEPSPAGGVPTS